MTPPKAPGYDEFAAAVDYFSERTIYCLGRQVSGAGFDALREARGEVAEARAALLAMWPGPGSGVSAELLADLVWRARVIIEAVRCADGTELDRLDKRWMAAEKLETSLRAIAAAEKQQAEKPGSELVEAVRSLLPECDYVDEARAGECFTRMRQAARNVSTALAKHDAAEKAGEGG